MFKYAAWFQNSEKEIRFVDYISGAFLVHIVLYTVGDIKEGYPFWLVLWGLIIHSLAVLTIFEKTSVTVKEGMLTRPKYFEAKTRVYIRKLLPWFLVFLYVTSYSHGVLIDDLQEGFFWSLLVSIWFTLPTIIYLFVLGYFKRKWLKWFKAKIRALNYLYLVLLMLLIVLSTSQ